jgi:ubiquitin carboxyl-terminal hydrolase 16
MPEKQLTIATYAAGASLAAITLVYVFAPTFFIDGEAGTGSAKGRKAVGLANSANDCFINSVLQALAGLGDLRIYLIRETHRRLLEGEAVYQELVEDPARKTLPPWKIDGLQRGIVTQGLKEMLDSLNERPLYKKTISPTPFIAYLENAFRQRISRQQQDAQEFLQVVAERLCDEYHAGHRARRRARERGSLIDISTNRTVPSGGSTQAQPLDEKRLERQLSRLANESDVASETSEPASAQPIETSGLNLDQSSASEQKPVVVPATVDSPAEGSEPDLHDDEEGFPLEGTSESQIECLTCGFKPRPSQTTFCTLTLAVPQVGSTTLSSCFDGMFKTEYIDDFKCEKCRLVHAVETLQQEVAKSKSVEFKTATLNNIERLKEAIDNDPEQAPEDIELPDSKFSPKRKIARHVRVTRFPKVLAIHLSRSIFDVGRSSMKNSAKVAFPERLPLGGLLDQKKYKLLGVVTHKGSHHSGHYESYRRQNIYKPFSTPNAFERAGVYSKSGTPTMSTVSTPQIGAITRDEDIATIPSTPELLSPVSDSPQNLSRVSLSSVNIPHHGSTDSFSGLPNSRIRSNGPTSTPRDTDSSSLRSVARSARSTISKVPASISNSLSRSSTPRSPASLSSSPYKGKGNNMPGGASSAGVTVNGNGTGNWTAKAQITSPIVKIPRKKKTSDRWWRISDEKVKESKTSEVLSMQREVYLLFYELEREGDD